MRVAVQSRVISTLNCIHPLATGVVSFIGSTLADRLVPEGRQVLGVDRLTSYYREIAKPAE